MVVVSPVGRHRTVLASVLELREFSSSTAARNLVDGQQTTIPHLSTDVMRMRPCIVDKGSSH